MKKVHSKDGTAIAFDQSGKGFGMAKDTTGKVVLDISISLDGFIAGPNDSREHPLGEGGMRLHDWMSNTSEDMMQGGTSATIRAIVTGRRTYDIVDGWGGSHPIHGVPVFVLSHNIPKKVPQGESTFTFVTDGMESAITQAKAAAGDKNIYVVGGANVAQQCVKAGLLDEILIHLVHVLLGEGVHLFDHLGTKHIELERAQVVDSPDVTHLRFRVVK